MRLTIDINMDNDAFKQNGESELKGIMRETMDKIHQGNTYGIIADSNGQRVGTFQIVTK